MPGSALESKGLIGQPAASGVSDRTLKGDFDFRERGYRVLFMLDGADNEHIWRHVISWQTGRSDSSRPGCRRRASPPKSWWSGHRARFEVSGARELQVGQEMSIR